MVNVLKDMENQKPAPSRSSPSSGSMDIVSLRKKAQTLTGLLTLLDIQFIVICSVNCVHYFMSACPSVSLVAWFHITVLQIRLMYYRNYSCLLLFN